MPTGYTAELLDKKLNFSQFAILCARAFGATVLMRDDPLNEEIPEFKPSDYSKNGEIDTRAKLALLTGMNDSETKAWATGIKNEKAAYHQTAIAEAGETNAKLDAMAAEVEKWDPPTGDHEGIKKFMLEQLEISKSSTEYHE